MSCEYINATLWTLSADILAKWAFSRKLHCLMYAKMVILYDESIYSVGALAERILGFSYIIYPPFPWNIMFFQEENLQTHQMWTKLTMETFKMTIWCSIRKKLNCFLFYSSDYKNWMRKMFITPSLVVGQERLYNLQATQYLELFQRPLWCKNEVFWISAII